MAPSLAKQQGSASSIYHSNWVGRSIVVAATMAAVTIACTYTATTPTSGGVLTMMAQAAQNEHVTEDQMARYNANRPAARRAARENRARQQGTSRNMDVASTAADKKKTCDAKKHDQKKHSMTTRRMLHNMGRRNKEQMEQTRTFDTAAVKPEPFENIDYTSDAYLSDGTFMWKFQPYQYNATEGVRSYIPLCWVSGYENYTGSYIFEKFDIDMYEYPEPSRRHQLYVSVPRGPANVNTSAHAFIQLGIQRMGDTASYVTINNNAAATTYIDNTGNNTLPLSDTGYDVECGTMLTIDSNVTFTAKPINGPLVATVEPLTIEVGTETPTTCSNEYSAKIWVGGDKAGKTALSKSGYLSYIYLSSNISTLDYDYNAAESLMLDNAVWNNTKGKLRSDGTAIVVHRIFQPYNLIGSSARSTERFTKLDIRQGALHTYVIDGPSMGAATLEPTTSNTVLCDMTEMSAYTVENIPFAGPTNKAVYGTTYNCFLYGTVEDATSACNNDAECTGFVTMQMQAFNYGGFDNFPAYGDSSYYSSFPPASSPSSMSSPVSSASSASTASSASSASAASSYYSSTYGSSSYGDSDDYGSDYDYFADRFGDSYYDYSVNYDESILTFPTELPYCQLKAGTDTLDGSRYPRAFYKKPSALNLPKCTIPVKDMSGVVDIYIQQSSMESGSVGVMVDGNLVKVCGARNAFANGYAGEDGECQNFALCYSGNVTAGSNIEVMALSALQMNGCASSLAVIANMTVVDAVKRVYVPPPVPTYIDVTSFSNRTIATTGTKARIFVGHAQAATLNLVQGAYGCVGRTCPDYIVEMASVGSCQRCGGNAKFHGNQIGLSDRCQRSQFCGSSMTLNASNSNTTSCITNGGASTYNPYTGFVTINFNTSAMVANSQTCDSPSGVFYVDKSNSTAGVAYLPAFPLQLGDGILRPLIAIPTTNSTSRASFTDAYLLAEAIRVTKNFSSTRTTRLTNIDVFGNPHAAFYVGAFYVGMPKIAQSTLLPNVSIACLLDHSGGKGVICEIPVPRLATQVDIKVSQSVFGDATITIEGINKGKTTYTNVCGKDAQFGKFPAASDRCNLFLSCSKRYLFTNDSLANNTDGVIRITFPSNVETDCDLEAAVIATFSDVVANPNTTCKSTEFQCGNQERKCIPLSNVCNYIQDCEDGGDESSCLNWKSIEEGGSSTLVDLTENSPGFKLTTFSVFEYPGVNTFQGCRIQAALARTIAFTVTNVSCQLYERAAILKVFKSISSYNHFSYYGEQTYIQVQADGGDSMDMCMSGVHCNGNGFVVYKDADVAITRPPCTCECNADAYGARCSETASLGATGKIEFGFSVNGPADTSDLSVASFRSALLEELDTKASVVCDSRIVMVSQTHAAMRCHISSSTGLAVDNNAMTTAALNTATIKAVNVQLTSVYFHLPVAYAIPTTVVATEVACTASSSNPCRFDVSGDVVNTNITGNMSVSKSGRSKLAKGILFEVTDDAFASTITIVLESGGTSSSSRVNRREVTCTPSISSSSGCKISTCILNQTEIQGMKRAYISNVSLTGVQDSAYDQCTTKQRSARVIQEGVSPLSPSAFNPDSKVTDYQAFLIIGTLIIAAGCGVALILALIFCCCHFRALAPYEERSKKEESKLRSMELRILGHLRYYEVEPDNRAWDNHAIRAGLCFFVLLIIGVLLILFFFTSYDRDSNYAPLVEEYPDANCDQSAFAFVPKRSFYINKNNTICKQQEVIGSSAESIYARGRCEGTSISNVHAIMQADVSLTGCQSASETKWTSDECLPIQTLLPSVTRTTYIKIRCAEAEFVEDRVKTLGLVAGNSSLSEFVNVTEVSANLKIPHFGANGVINGKPGDKVFSFPYLQGQVVRTSTSTHPVRVASHGDMSGFDGNADGIRLVGQNADSFATSVGSSTIKAQFEDKHESTMDRLTLSQLTSFIPTDITKVTDQPIGYVLNGFTESADGTTGAEASKNALRYYGIRRTPFDIGAYFPQNVDLADGMGMTISMFVRARSTTRGFIFAITDVVENAVTNENYLLTKLWDMIINAQPASRWYTDTSYSVYSSLFLNGPSQTLTFAYVDSSLPDKLHQSASEREELVTMNWNLENLGLTRLLNGDWHALTITLRVENEKLKATLGVDGETSYSAEGWSNCVPRFPSPIKEISLGTSMPTKDSSEDVVKPGGELMVGYMNGGVYAFTVRTEVISPDNLLLEDTQAARNFDDFPRDDLQILAGVLFFFGIVGIIVVIVVTVPEVAKTGAEGSKAKYRTAAIGFYTTTLPLTNFSIEDAATGIKTPRDRNDTPADDEKFDAIRFNTALRLTNCTVEAFQALLDDVSSQAKKPGLAILTVIYNANNSEPDFTIKESVTSSQWNEMVRQDEKDELAKDAKRCFGKPKPDEEGNILTREAEEDIEMCSGNVFYQGGEFLKGILGGMNNNHEGVKGGGAGEGLGKGVDFKTDGGTNSMQMGSATNSNTGTMASSFLDLFAPVIVVFQSAFVWITSIGLPSDYKDMFGNFFSFLSIDFVNAFPNLPTLLTPLMQLAAGLLLLALLAYLLLQDRRTFDFNLMRYVYRRDTLEGTKSERAEAAESLGEDVLAIDERAVPLPEFNLVTLSLAESRRVDYFTKIAEVPEGLEARFGSLPTDESTKVKLTDGSSLTVTRGEKKGEVVYNVEDNKMLTNIPTMCQLHPTRRLCPALQTKVYPYSCPPRCAVVINGQRCGKSIGIMFTCGYHDPQVDGTNSVCTYAICQAHMIMKPVDLAKAHLYGTFRMLKNRGFWWILTALLLTVAHALYTPVLKTAMMVASCHPFYQCEFKQCWSDPDQKFIIAAFLAITLIVLFGIGVPLIEFIVLMSRGRKLGLAFHGKEYEHRYDEEEKSTTALIYKKITGEPLLQVKYLEWSRFLETDFSRMAVTYKVVKFSALFVPPLLIAYKVAVVAPAVLLEAGSLDQRIAISAVELLFGVIMFATNAFITPFVTLTFRVASIHQLLVLGMSAASAVYKYDTGKDLGNGIITITFIYIIFNVVVLILTVIWPVLSVLLANRRAKKLVTEHGYEYSQGMALWVDPVAHDAEHKELVAALGAPSAFGDDKNDNIKSIKNIDSAADHNDNDVSATFSAESPIANTAAAPLSQRRMRNSLMDVEDAGSVEDLSQNEPTNNNDVDDGNTRGASPPRSETQTLPGGVVSYNEKDEEMTTRTDSLLQ